MRKQGTRLLAFVLAMTMILAVGTGCGKSKQAKEVVFTVNGEDVNLDEVWFYCKSVQSYYENYYSSMFTSQDVWNMDYPIKNEDGTTEKVPLSEVAKKSAISQLRQIKIVNQQAKKMKITLSDEEKKQAKTQAKTFMESVTADEKKEMGLTEDLVVTVFEQSAIVQKVMEKLAEDNKVEISDEDARQAKAYKIMFMTKSYDANGKLVEASKEKKAEAKKDAEKALKECLKENANMDYIAAKYQMTGNSGEVTFDKTTGLPTDVSKIALGMKENQVYDKVIESDDGYYIIKLISLNDEEATANKKSSLLNEKEQELLDKKIAEWTKDDSFNYDKDVKASAMKKIEFKYVPATTQAPATTKAGATTAATTTTEAATTTEKK